jgi:hypothetical protein
MIHISVRQRYVGRAVVCRFCFRVLARSPHHETNCQCSRCSHSQTTEVSTGLELVDENTLVNRVGDGDGDGIKFKRVKK